MAQDFRNSTAQLAVDFTTGIIVTTNPGDNYMRLALFVDDNPAYFKVDATKVPIDENHHIYVANKNNYADIAQGRLLTWLTDYFCTGNGYDAYIVVLNTGGPIGTGGFTDVVQADFDFIYQKLKGLAYLKSMLIQDDNEDLHVEAAVFFAALCAQDELLSSPPFWPHNATDPADATTCALYQALKGENIDAFLSYHSDIERNPALFQLGKALSSINMSGTPVGNGLDFDSSTLITPSGYPSAIGAIISEYEDYNLTSGQQFALENINVAYFRTVGNGTGATHAVGIKTINGVVFAAKWIVQFCNYVNKVKVAEIITVKNTLRNKQTYARILNAMMGTVGRFTLPDDDGFLIHLANNAPAFTELPPSGGREFIIPNAWSADYVFTVDSVKVYGSLTIAQ